MSIKICAILDILYVNENSLYRIKDILYDK